MDRVAGHHRAARLSSSGIATNNLSVALTAWSGGMLAGLVPLYVVLLNGLMLGAILGVTLHYSMAGALLEFVCRPRPPGADADPGLGRRGPLRGPGAGGGGRPAPGARRARGGPRLPRRAARLPPLVRPAGAGGGLRLALAGDPAGVKLTLGLALEGRSSPWRCAPSHRSRP